MGSALHIVNSLADDGKRLRGTRSELDVVAESRDRFLVSGASGSLDPTDGLVLTPGPHDEFTICAAVVCSAALTHCCCHARFLVRALQLGPTLAYLPLSAVRGQEISRLARADARDLPSVATVFLLPVLFVFLGFAPLLT